MKIEASNINFTCSQSKPTCRLNHTHMLVRKDLAEWVKKPWGGLQKLCERWVPRRRGNAHIYSTYPLSAYTPVDAWAVECARSPPANNYSCQYMTLLLQGAFFFTILYHNSHWMFGLSRVRKTPGPIKPFLFLLLFLFWLFLCILIYFLCPPAWYMVIMQFYPKTIILYCNSGICL